MAERVVDLLEVVEVEHQHRAHRVLAAAAGQLGAQVFAEAAPVLQPGQRVLARLQPQFLHLLVAAPDQHQRAEQRRQGDADDRDQDRQADAGPVRIVRDEGPRAIGDPQGRRGGFVAVEAWPDDRPAALDQLDVDFARQRRGRRRRQVRDTERAEGEADERRAALRHGPRRRPVAVDGPEDVDPGAAERQPDHGGCRRCARVARPQQAAGADRVGADVVAVRRGDVEVGVGGDVAEREVACAVSLLVQGAEPAAGEDREAVVAFEAGTGRVGQPRG